MPSNHRQSPPQAKKGPRSYSDPLQQESARVIADVQAPLKDLVTVRLQPSNGPRNAAQLTLTLHFTNHSHNSDLWRFIRRNGVDAERISDALDAIMQVYTHSTLLISRGKLHADFWTQLLSSKVMVTEVSEDILTWTATEMVDAKHFSLRLVLDFGGRKRGKLDKKWLDAVFMFMTESPECSKMFERQDCRNRKKKASQAKILFGLSFANSRLTIKCLLKIQRLLECTAPGCNRHYGIDMLDISQNKMNTEQLDVVDQILKRNHIYQTPDIRLDEVNKHSLSKSESRIIRLSDMSRTPTEWQSDIRITIPTISPVTNQCGVQHVISVCSALRYGCTFEELSLTSLISLVEPSERELCWRWLAFGVFYPRSKRFANQFKLRKIKLLNSDSSKTGMKAFASALRNPVAEFRRPDWPEDGDHTDAVLVGAIEKGATVYSSADKFSKPLMALVCQQELEILHSRYDDKWVCVVVPGVGSGWLQANHVINVERGLEKYENHVDARFDLVVSGPAPPVQIMMIKPETHTFIETVGECLRSLSMKNSKGFSIATLLYHCTNLEHLDLEGCELNFEASGNVADRPKERGLGNSLALLNLNRTSFNDTDMQHLKWDLDDPLRMGKLKEFHLYNIQMTHIGLEDLFAALLKNKTLSILELEQPRDNANEVEKRTVCTRIDEACQNQTLKFMSVPLSQRLAFLSAVFDPNSRVQEAAEALNPTVYASIFHFAQESERRKIIWTKFTTPVTESLIYI